MYKKWVLVTVLLCSLSMTGCVVINNGEEDTKGSGQNSETSKAAKEVEVRYDNSSVNSSNLSDNSSSRAYEVDEYVFFDSDNRYLTYTDLSSLSDWELKIARNEIYARRGRLFKDSSLQKYFDSCSWYNGYISSDNFDDGSLNSVEAYNIKLIKNYE